jgi:glycosyltransferase involved in cell wall biosynthesis
MPKPLVSVMMITYNHASFVARAIERVLRQKTAFPFELVIGEDHSTDGTREIVFEYQAKYPHIIRIVSSDKNVGIQKNAYRTMKACRGKYIAFCEGDDYWVRTDKLKLQVEYLESHLECGMVSADCDIYYNKSGNFKRNYNHNHGFQSSINLTAEQVLWRWLPIWTCTVMIRHSLYEQIVENDPYLHQDAALPLGDIQLWFETAMISEVTYIPETLATYRVLSESVSRSRDVIKNLRFDQSLCDVRLYLCDKYNLSENCQRKAELSWCDTMLRKAFYTRDVDLATRVKMRTKTFTWKKWFMYFGVKYTAFYYTYLATLWLYKFFRKEQTKFP